MNKKEIEKLKTVSGYHGTKYRAIYQFVLNKETGKDELEIVDYENTQETLQALAETVSLANVMTINPLTGETILKRRVEELEYMDTRGIPKDILEYTKLSNKATRSLNKYNEETTKYNKEMQLKEEAQKVNKGEIK